MATKTRSNAKNDDKGIFDWGDARTGVIVGAAVAGAAVGLAANVGRKLFMQMTSGATGTWAEALKTEHDLARAIFDKLEATTEDDTVTRGALLAKLKYALTKHAVEEEMVIYPALRHAGRTAEADELNAEHGYVKTFLYELETLPNDDPQWIAKVRQFRTMIEEHMREEETEIFPGLEAQLPEERNAELTAMMNKEGFKVA